MNSPSTSDFQILDAENRIPNGALVGKSRPLASAQRSLAHEVQSLLCQLHFALEEISPDAHGRQVGEGASEGFDGQPAVVLVRLQRGEGLGPAHKPLSGRAAMVLRDVDMRENRR